MFSIVKHANFLPHPTPHFHFGALSANIFLSYFLSFLVQSLPRVIPLNVGGYNFVTTLSTLTKDKNSMLAAMFSGRHELDTDSEGRYFIDRDGTYFKHILNFLRDGNQLPSADVALEVYIPCSQTRP